uniref:Non-specific serine/threonine protein kinase n=1 Tax=Bursaphelenchus xylophilus TaxID=6326 RepID=A0A1I7RWM5_BURXY
MNLAIKTRLPKEELYRIYKDKLVPLFHAEMGNYLRKTAMNPSAYYQKQRNYTVTTAAMSALGHIVGLGDRHLGNILVDATNGDVMHVDFNLLFNSGEMLTVPEIVPFRLTRNVVDAFGPTGVEGRFRIAFERIIKFLQAEKPAILRILKSFIYDPLIDWRIDDENDHATYTRRSNLTNISVQDRIELVRDRLDGYLHTTIQPKIGPITDERVLVSKLIELAMDEESLSRMYFGWSPFV